MAEDIDIPEVRWVEGTGIPIRGDDIDTDQILPSRFMRVVTFEGLGQFAFFDKRFDSASPEESRGDDGDGVEVDEPKDHPMNDECYQGANVLVVNKNFGCGSSREHAPQALMRWGIDAIVGESFGEIFTGNCLALGIPTVTADHETVTALQDHLEDEPECEVVVDVAGESLRYGDTTRSITVDDVQYDALVEGTWDVTALLRANEEAIEHTAEQLPYADRR